MSDLDPRRAYNKRERIALFVTADGKCSLCHELLQPGFHGDHVRAFSKGGITDVINGQALCPACNLKKGASMFDNSILPSHIQLRDYQQDALETYMARLGDFLMVATPGAGKTLFALACSLWEMSKTAGGMKKIVVVVPRSSLRYQWSREAAKVGIHLDPRFGEKVHSLAPDYDGVVVTYQSVTRSPLFWRQQVARQPTLVILDEIHHAGEAAHLQWAAALREAFDPAQRRLLLTGTPFRSDRRAIPFIRYDDSGKACPDFNYDYGTALREDVVRPVEFLTLNGNMQWQPPRDQPGVGDADGIEEMALDEVPNKKLASALRTAFDPQGQWIPSVLRRADEELTRQRQLIPDAGGLVVASGQSEARAYGRMLAAITGEEPIVVLSGSDDDEGEDKRKNNSLKSSELIEAFAAGSRRWIVAVNMISEGVDIPRLAVGVYASNVRTEMFFRQVVGRLVRKRRLLDDDRNEMPDGTISTMFIPSVGPLMKLAADIENTIREAILGPDDISGNEGGGGGGERHLAVPIGSGESVRHSAISSGDRYDEPRLALAERIQREMRVPTTLSTVQLLKFAEAFAHASGAASPPSLPTPPLSLASVAPVPLFVLKKQKQDRLNKLVQQFCFRTGSLYSEVNQDLIQFRGNIPLAQASLDQIEASIAEVTRWGAMP